MSELAKIERKLDRLTKLVEQKQKPLWVKAAVITGLTGWNNEKMRSARENGYIDWKKDDAGFWYDLQTLSDKFIKKHA